MNVTHSTNAKKGPKEDFNAYKDFTEIETDALVITATLTHFKMKNIDGIYTSLIFIRK